MCLLLIGVWHDAGSILPLIAKSTKVWLEEQIYLHDRELYRWGGASGTCETGNFTPEHNISHVIV